MRVLQSGRVCMARRDLKKNKKKSNNSPTGAVNVQMHWRSEKAACACIFKNTDVFCSTFILEAVKEAPMNQRVHALGE